LSLSRGLIGALAECGQASREDSYCNTAQSAFHLTTSISAGGNFSARSQLGEDTGTS
jgi:hypothetical protein